jgi:hypothetical protein
MNLRNLRNLRMFSLQAFDQDRIVNPFTSDKSEGAR